MKNNGDEVIEFIDNIIKHLHRQKEKVINELEEYGQTVWSESTVLYSISQSLFEPKARWEIDNDIDYSISKAYDTILEKDVDFEKINGLKKMTDFIYDCSYWRSYSLQIIPKHNDFLLTYGYGIDNAMDRWKKEFGSEVDWTVERSLKQLRIQKTREYLEPYIKEEYENKEELISDFTKYMKDIYEDLEEPEQETEKPKAMKM